MLFIRCVNVFSFRKRIMYITIKNNFISVKCTLFFKHFRHFHMGQQIHTKPIIFTSEIKYNYSLNSFIVPATKSAMSLFTKSVQKKAFQFFCLFFFLQEKDISLLSSTGNIFLQKSLVGWVFSLFHSILFSFFALVGDGVNDGLQCRILQDPSPLWRREGKQMRSEQHL